MSSEPFNSDYLIQQLALKVWMERLMDGRLKWCYSQLLSVLLLFKLMLSRDNPTGHRDEHEVDIRHKKLCV